jgi:hypothetical protein
MGLAGVQTGRSALFEQAVDGGSGGGCRIARVREGPAAHGQAPQARGPVSPLTFSHERQAALHREFPSRLDHGALQPGPLAVAGLADYLAESSLLRRSAVAELARGCGSATR